MGSKAETQKFDIVIAGGGPTGMTMARALGVALGHSAKIALVDRNSGFDPETTSPSVQQQGPFAMALCAGAKQMLEVLGVWDKLGNDAQPVTNIDITDSSLNDAVRPAILSYRNSINGSDPASYIVENRHLLSTLQQTLAGDPAITVLRGNAIETFAADENGVEAVLTNGSKLKAALLIAADGRRSKLRQMAGIKTVAWDHEQIGIVTIVTHDKVHNGRAVQHFLPAGPFAILPLKPDIEGRNRSCITWSEKAAHGREIMSLDDAGFCQEVQKRFGHELGQVALETQAVTEPQSTKPVALRASWPLTTLLARSFIANRLALVGDAAHGVHPIAGQGRGG